MADTFSSILDALSFNRGGRAAPAVKPADKADSVGSILDSLSFGQSKSAKGSVGSSPNSYKDPAWDRAELAAAQATGVPAAVIRSIRVNGEKSNGDQVSGKGARGVYQFIESSRNAFKKKYGVDAYSQDPNEQALAAAYHLKEGYGRTRDWARTVAGYNGGISGEKGTNTTDENINYVKRVMPSVNAATQKLSDASQYQDAWAHDNFAQADLDNDTSTLAAINPDDEAEQQQA